MRNKVIIQILVNACIVVFGWAGLMVMDDMANAENAGRLTAYHAAQKVAATEMVKAQLDAKRAGFDRCTTTPFLTDHVLIIGSKLGGTYYTGVVYDVTLDEALATADKYVLAYCE